MLEALLRSEDRPICLPQWDSEDQLPMVSIEDSNYDVPISELEFHIANRIHSLKQGVALLFLYVVGTQQCGQSYKSDSD